MVNKMLATIRKTTDEQFLGAIRILLGMIFLSTGLMKFLVPMLWVAWSGQLAQARIPFPTLNLYFVPMAEMLIGVLLLLGVFARLGALVAIPMMIVATYVHIVVTDPNLFPLQPEEPFIPIVVLALSGYVLWRGAGSWSLDLISSRRRKT